MKIVYGVFTFVLVVIALFVRFYSGSGRFADMVFIVGAGLFILLVTILQLYTYVACRRYYTKNSLDMKNDFREYRARRKAGECVDEYPECMKYYVHQVNLIRWEALIIIPYVLYILTRK